MVSIVAHRSQIAAHTSHDDDPSLRKLVLTAHITSSVGFLGAAATFLALAVIGLMSRDEQIMRAAYLGMALITWSVVVPLSLAPLLIGLVQFLGTPWGLFQHYWVLVKLLPTLLCTTALLVHTQPIDYLASKAQGGHFPVPISAARGSSLWSPPSSHFSRFSRLQFYLCTNHVVRRRMGGASCSGPAALSER